MRRTSCDYSIRHPRQRELVDDARWVTVSGWDGEWCLCGGCCDYLHRLGRTVTNVDPDFRPTVAEVGSRRR